MDKLKLHSKDLTAENIEKLAALFPNCMTETQAEDGSVKHGIDFDLLRQELSDDLVEGPQERYRLDWPGKREALATANQPINLTLRPDRDESENFDTTENLYIEGDNLDALKLLQETYLGKVKMIYIDPPYNTGHDFIYDDNYSMTRDDYRFAAGDVDEEGNQMFDEEKWQENSNARGRFHSEWLSMIYPRLKLAKNLLSDDGVIFISCNNCEVSNLMRIGSEIFGSDNLLPAFVWKSRVSEDLRAITGISDDCEYVVGISKYFGTKLKGVPKDLTKFSNPDSDPRGPWRSADMTGLATIDKRPNLHYLLTNSETGLSYECPEKGWRFEKSTMQKRITQNKILWPENENGRPRQKLFISEMADTLKSITSFINSKVASTSSGTKELKALFDESLFDFPKPSKLVSLFVEQAASSSAIILDFFSGSATTAHAVMKLNAEDGGTRKHIQVQLPEPCDEKSAAFKAGYSTIAEIGKERIRRAGTKIREELAAQIEGETIGSDKHTELTEKLAKLDTGFRVLKVDSSNMTADYYKRPDETTQDALALSVENIKPDRQPEDLLFQVMLDWGVDLALPITTETIEGKTVYFVAPGTEDNQNAALAACFDTALDDTFSQALAKKKPLRAVFRDASFANDAARINVEQYFKTLSPSTEVKAI